MCGGLCATAEIADAVAVGRENERESKPSRSRNAKDTSSHPQCFKTKKMRYFGTAAKELKEWFAPELFKLVTFSIPSCSVHTRRPFEFQNMRIKYCALGIKIREDKIFRNVIEIFVLCFRISDLVVLLKRHLIKLLYLQSKV